VILEEHLKYCVSKGIESGDPEKTFERFAKAVERFANYEMKI